MAFQKAVREKLSAKIALEGAAGSGKTWSALLLARGFGGKTAFIDTENRSALLYADREFDPRNHPGEHFEFDWTDLKAPFSPERYIDKILEAQNAGYQNLIIDSATHEWDGEGGVLDLHSEMAKGGEKNKFTVWDKLTPRHNKFVRTVLDSPMNIISCFRTKTAYEMSTDASTGKTKVEKLGTKPITREGFDFECTIVFNLNPANIAEATKDRTSLYVGVQNKLCVADGKKIIEYLSSGADRAVLEAAATEERKAKLLAWCQEEWTKIVGAQIPSELIGDSLFSFIKSKFASVKAESPADYPLTAVEAIAVIINKQKAAVNEFLTKYAATL